MNAGTSCGTPLRTEICRAGFGPPPAWRALPKSSPQPAPVNPGPLDRGLCGHHAHIGRRQRSQRSAKLPDWRPHRRKNVNACKTQIRASRGNLMFQSATRRHLVCETLSAEKKRSRCSNPLAVVRCEPRRPESCDFFGAHQPLLAPGGRSSSDAANSAPPRLRPLPFLLTSGIIRVCLDLAGLFRNKDIHLC